MPTPISPGEANDILTFVAKFPAKTVKEVAREFGRHESAIRELIAKYKPTTVLARATILSRASELVDRVLEKADVDQLIDVLQRTNVGVLDPITKPGAGGGGSIGVLISVQPGSLAAVDASTYQDGKHLPPEPVEGEVLSPRKLQVGPTPLGEFSG